MADELRKILMAGFGAVATAIEKTAGALSEATKPENAERVKVAMEDLAKKGEEAYEKSRAAGSELFAKIGDAFSGLKNLDVDDIKARLGDLADDALDEVGRAVGELKRRRAEARDRGADADAGGESTGMHPESGDKPDGAAEDMAKAAGAEAPREDGEDLS